MNTCAKHGRASRPDSSTRQGSRRMARAIINVMISSALAWSYAGPVLADTPAPGTTTSPEPGPSSGASPGEGSSPAEPTASPAPTSSASSPAEPPSPAPVVPSTAPPPPGAQTTWSSADGSAPSTQWFDSWQQAVRTPAGGGNVLLPWESPSGQVQVGQGVAVTGGWSIVDAHGNAGAGISCGSVCGSGWFPMGFGSDGRPSSWVRVIQQTTAVDGNAVTGAGRYDTQQGWIMPGANGSHSWNWQTNELGPCVQQCADPNPVGPDPANPSATLEVMSVGSGANSPVGTMQAGATATTRGAERATRIQALASGAVAVHVTDGTLRRGTVVDVIVWRGSQVLRQWQATASKRGSIRVTVPRGSRSTRIELRVGTRLVGLGSVGSTP